MAIGIARSESYYFYRTNITKTGSAKDTLKIRREQAKDCKAIHQLTTEAFSGLPYSDGSEPHIIDRLRADGDLTLSLLAVSNDNLIGHIAFSPVTIGNHTSAWYGLGPVSVRPNRQRSGIGSALINEGLRILKNMGANGCALIGNPDYYSRFGFISNGAVQYEDLEDKYVQWKSFGEQRPEGVLIYSPGFQT